MTADQAKATAEFLGQQLEMEWKLTLRVLRAIPEAKKDYKPDPDSRAAFELARHLAGADIWFLNGAINGTFGDPAEAEPQAATVAELGEWYKQNFPTTLERALALDGARLAAIVDFYGMKMPTIQFLLLALVHMVHHRGQLAAYLRPSGGKVPSIYGSSHDEQWTGAQEASA
jgi:uncharacterized damage-inducible protein DinB